MAEHLIISTENAAGITTEEFVIVDEKNRPMFSGEAETTEESEPEVLEDFSGEVPNFIEAEIALNFEEGRGSEEILHTGELEEEINSDVAESTTTTTGMANVAQLAELAIQHGGAL